MLRPRIILALVLTALAVAAAVWWWSGPASEDWTAPTVESAAAGRPETGTFAPGADAPEAGSIFAPRAADYELDAPRRRDELGKALPFREAPVAAETMRLLQNGRRGNVLSLELFPDRRLTVRLTGRWDDDNELRVAGRLDGRPETDRLFMSWHRDEMRGLIELPSENAAYEILLADGGYIVREWLLTDVMCATPSPGGRSASTGLPQPSGILAPTGQTSFSSAAIEVPALRSKPGETRRVIYLDFDGETVSGTAWAGGATIVAPPARLNPTQIREVWERVSRDFEPFRVNVTTVRADYDNADSDRRTHVIITSNDQASPGSGGVAWINSFNSSNNSFKIAWAFIDDRPRSCAVIITHEVGHTLGLNHDGRVASGSSPREEYYEGHGTGETGWAPIMGVGFYRDLVQWSRGEYFRANNFEDDLAIITDSTRIPYDVDDHGTTMANATAVQGDRAEGIIGRNTDVDFFRVSLAAGPHTLFLTGAAFGSADLELQVFGANGQSIGVFNPPDQLSATANFNLPEAQDVFLRVRGVGKGDPLGLGYTDYGSLGSYSITGFGTQQQPPSAPIGLSTTRLSGSQIRINWTPNPSATTYTVWRDGVELGSVFGAEFLDTQVVPSTTYSYTVTAGNAYGTSLSSQATVVTSAAFDEFIMDGEADFEGYLLSDPGMRIYAAVRGTRLYVATWSPGDNGSGAGSDHFIFVSDTLLGSATTPAPWTKRGLMAIPGNKPFIGGESESTFASWFNTSGPTALFKSRLNSGMMEGVIDLVAEFGRVPEQVYVAAVAYGTADNDGINSQAPAGNGNDNLEPAEFLRIPVRHVADAAMNGVYDTLDGTRGFRAQLAAGAQPVLRWPVVPGRVYRVQGRESLESGGWSDLTPSAWTAGPSQWEMEFTDPASAGTARFYRVVRP